MTIEQTIHESRRNDAKAALRIARKQVDLESVFAVNKQSRQAMNAARAAIDEALKLLEEPTHLQPRTKYLS